VSEQGHNFAFETNYSGFVWDLPNKRVSLSDKKRLKHLTKLDNFLSLSTVNEKDVASLHGTLQHISFVYRDGRAYLPALSHMASHFTNHWSRHHISSAVRNDILWWKKTLSFPSTSRSLLPRLQAGYDIWVDASTSWGIGILIDQQWMAWKLRSGWDTEGRDIGWAESVSVELAVLWITEQNLTDREILVHGDNTGVIDSYKKGRSRNIPRNSSIQRITASLIPSNLTITPIFVPSECNLADPISRGNLGPSECRLAYHFELPTELQPFLLHV
jgi:hypothetical protein